MAKKEEMFVLLENGAPTGDYLMSRDEVIGFIEEVLEWENPEDVAGKYEVLPFVEENVKRIIIEAEVNITF